MLKAFFYSEYRDMPLPKPSGSETQTDFIARCMSSEKMRSEFPEQKQRAAVCYSQWKGKGHKSNSGGEMSTEMQTLKVLVGGTTRREMWNGAEHLVLPAVYLTEGVHNGAFYPAAELAKYPGAWDGRPIPIRHPEDDQGNRISCNGKDVWPNSVGLTFNTHYEDSKLKGELWLSIPKLNQIRPDLVSFFENGGSMDISSGLWADSINQAGDWNGEHYNEIVHGLRPDHIALLPDQEGACNWGDGCGAPRVNVAETEETEKSKQKIWDRIRGWLRPNEASHEQIRGKLKDAIRSEVTSSEYAYPVDVYDKYFIYTVENDHDNTTRIYRRGYTVDEKDTVALAKEKTEVQLETKYVPITNNAQGGAKMKIKEMVDALITNERTPWEEAHRETLLGLSECVLTKLMPPAETETPKVNSQETAAPVPAATTVTVVKEETAQPSLTLDALLSSDRFGEMIVNAVDSAINKKKKAELVAKVKAFKGLALEDAEIEAMPESVLEKIVKVNVASDFSGRGFAQMGAEADGVPEPPKVLTAELSDDEKKGGSN